MTPQGVPAVGTGAGIGSQGEVSPSSGTDFVVRWVRRWVTRLHHIVLHQFWSQGDGEEAEVAECGKANKDGIKSYISEKEIVTVLREIRGQYTNAETTSNEFQFLNG